MTINILPDDALLEIFHFCREGHGRWWKTLVDVCRRWRDIIFASPYSLDVRLECTNGTPTRTSLDIWPPIPLTISCYSHTPYGDDNIIAALEHHDRIVQIDIQGFGLEKFFAVTERPFPILTDLCLSSYGLTAPVLDDEFLGGSAPSLRRFKLGNIAFPAFPKLALSATHLSSLTLWDIPKTGYLSPEVVVTCLAMLPNLHLLRFGFPIHPRLSRPDQKTLPPPKPTVLSALTFFAFKGVSEYLEDLISRIDTPRLNRLEVCLEVDLIIHIPQLHNFIAHSECIRPLNPAKLLFFTSIIRIILGSLNDVVDLLIRLPDTGTMASSMAQVCSQLSPLLSQVEQLDIHEGIPGQSRQGNLINSTWWFNLFDHFPAVQYLHIYHELRPLVVQALQELTGERATQVLPCLRSLVFEGSSPSGSIQEDIQGFITLRQNSNHPVDVHWA